MNEQQQGGMWSVPTLSAAVADWIATGIVSGRWNAGDRLREIEVCEELRVSRAPVREALRSLQEKGLVRLVPRIGAVVNQFSTETVMDVYEVRSTLERWVCLKSVPALESEDVDQLADVLDGMQRAKKAGEIDRFFENGWTFRTTLYSGATNAVALEMIDQLRGRLHSIPQVLRRTADKRHIDDTLATYTSVLASVRDGDAAVVGDAIAAFMLRTGSQVCEKFAANGTAPVPFENATFGGIDVQGGMA